jgi:uncharacterized coiled-coil DUF342 family protein
MEINQQYRGRNAAAITTYNGMYSVQAQTSIEELTRQLEGLRNFNPPGRVVKRFDGVNPKAFKILREAAKKLESGEEVNLEELLN